MKHVFYLAVASLFLFSCEKDDSDIAEKFSKNAEQNDQASDRVTASISYYHNPNPDQVDQAGGGFDRAMNAIAD